jgi:hypothetical protein
MTRVFAKFGLIGRTYWSKCYIRGEWWTINLRLVNKEFDRHLVCPGIQSLSITGHHKLAGSEHMWQIKISKSYGYSNLLPLVRRRDSIPEPLKGECFGAPKGEFAVNSFLRCQKFTDHSIIALCFIFRSNIGADIGIFTFSFEFRRTSGE